MKVKIKIIENGKKPEFKTAGAACADAYARVADEVMIYPHQTKVIPLGFATEFDKNYYLEVRGRSGNAVRGIWINTGTVDSDYRGEVGAITLNTTDEPVCIHNGDRIAQIMLKAVISTEFEQVETLTDTDRGAAGFGSTGVK